MSLLPAVVTIVLAFATRQVLAALFMGIVTGSVVFAIEAGDLSKANPISTFLLPSIGSSSYAQILLIYLWALGGLIGIWERTGAARHFAETAGARMARDRRTALLFSWILGVVFHQGGTISTVLTGSTVKPLADKHRVSHEELAYVVDSTASPVATILVFNAWPAYVASLVLGTIPLFQTLEDSEAFFISSIKWNFYAVVAVLGTLLFSLGVLNYGRTSLGRARERALSGGGFRNRKRGP